MALNQEQAEATVRTLLRLREPEQVRLERIAAYSRGDHSSVYVPKSARDEYHWLRSRAKVNMLQLVVSVVAQNLYVDGYRPTGSDENSKVWKFWQANRMDARQHGIHRAALKYGISYATVLPGQPVPVITPMTPRRMTAFYADPANDEWPIYSIEVTSERIKAADGKLVARQLIRLYDNTATWRFTGDIEGRSVRYVSKEDHDLGVCPVVRYVNELNLDEDEAVAGEVEPLIELQDQINSTTFNLLMAQQYSAFRQRWVTGMAPVLDAEGNVVEPFQVGVNRLLQAVDSDTKFGEFGETSLEGYLRSREESIREMATISQTPPYYLLGQMANLSAESLVAARDGLDRKVEERKSSFGEAHEQTLRLAGLAAADETAWTDDAAQVVWRDTSSRALAATVDALGKLSQMLGVPQRELWEKIPGVTQTDVERWKATAAEADVLQQMNAMLERQMGGAAEEPELVDGQPAG
ncbi:phage portal protein [Nonomuraea sp. NPDC059023]|uniref:phage portal protein n=1 Tax=unclassified Nonomuraea TaxID=2593643 RepID=UPI003690DB02